MGDGFRMLAPMCWTFPAFTICSPRASLTMPCGALAAPAHGLSVNVLTHPSAQAHLHPRNQFLMYWSATVEACSVHAGRCSCPQ